MMADPTWTRRAFLAGMAALPAAAVGLQGAMLAPVR